jgi:hypothetical protein
MLADIVVPSDKIVFRGGEFSVRGITFDSVARLIASGQRSDIDLALEELMGAKDDPDQLMGALAGLVAKLPDLTAKVIAEAAGEPEHWEKVKQFPVPVQLDALLVIGKLTFDGEDSVKNFVRGVLQIVKSAKTLSLSSLSPTTAVTTGSAS